MFRFNLCLIQAEIVLKYLLRYCVPIDSLSNRKFKILL